MVGYQNSSLTYRRDSKPPNHQNWPCIPHHNLFLITSALFPVISCTCLYSSLILFFLYWLWLPFSGRETYTVSFQMKNPTNSDQLLKLLTHPQPFRTSIPASFILALQTGEKNIISAGRLGMSYLWGILIMEKLFSFSWAGFFFTLCIGSNFTCWSLV